MAQFLPKAASGLATKARTLGTRFTRKSDDVSKETNAEGTTSVLGGTTLTYLHGYLNPLSWDTPPTTVTTTPAPQCTSHVDQSDVMRDSRRTTTDHDEGEMKKEKRMSKKYKQPKGTVSYTVSSTDTLASVAAQFDTTTSELKKLNRLMSQMVFPGQVLFVPDKDFIDERSPSCSPDVSPVEDKSIVQSIAPQAVNNAEAPTMVRPSARLPGRVHRLSSSECESQAAPPVTPPAVMQSTTVDCQERFIKVNVKHITDGEGVVSGVLLVTPNAVMFDPNVSDPLVIEKGAGDYGMIAPMETVLSAALYHDIASMRLKGVPRDTEESLHPKVYHSTDCPLYSAPSPPTSPPLDIPRTTTSKPVTVMNSVDSVCSCRSLPNDDDDDLQSEPIALKRCPASTNVTIDVKEDIEPPLERRCSEGDFFEAGVAVSEPVTVTAAAPSSSGIITRTLESLSSSLGSPSFTSIVDFSSVLLAATIGGTTSTSSDDESSQRSHCHLVTRSREPSPSGRRVASDGELVSIEVEVENAVHLEDKPELFRSLDELLPKPVSLYEEPPLYLCLKVGRPVHRDGAPPLSRTCPIEAYVKRKAKPEYWFSIPRDKVDVLYAFFVQWSPSIYGAEDTDAAERGFVVVSGEDVDSEEEEEEGEEMATVEDHFSSSAGSSSSKRRHRCKRQMTKDWEIINVEEARRRRASEMEENLPLPELSDPSSIMITEHIRKLTMHLPARAVGYPWRLVYSSDRHGFSLQTLYRSMQHVESHILLLVKDSNDRAFGAILSEALKISDHFYGTGESFLFTFFPEFKKFTWTGNNDFFTKGNAQSLAIGAGEGSFGIWLDGDLYHGRTQSCRTYDNDLLTDTEDFIMKAVEAWAFI